MTKADEARDWIRAELAGRKLAEVSFGLDDLHLEFNGPRLHCYIWPRVTAAQGTAGLGEPGYRDLLCGQIGKSIGGITLEDNVIFRILFTDGSMIEVSLKPEDYRCPEALNFDDGKDGFGVW
jgi:hypothetical protein